MKNRLSRDVAVEVTRAADGEPPTFSASLSSELSYPRWFGNEILDHSEGSVDLARSANGLPLLFGHNPDVIVGRVENVRLDGRRLRGDLRFFPTDRGNEVRTLLEHGHREISVGYTIDKMREIGDDNGVKTYRATKWSLLEASVVGVPADATIGVGRAAETREMPEIEVETRGTETTTTVTHKTCTMTEDTTTTVVEVSDGTEDPADATDPAGDTGMAGMHSHTGVIQMSEQTTAPASQVPEIINLGERFKAKGGDVVAQDYLRSGRSDMAEFQSILLEKVGSQPAQTSDLGMTQREVRRFSFNRLISALASPSDRVAREAAAFEFEASEAAIRAQGRSFRGNAQATIPMDVLYGQRDLIAGTSTMGGYTVGTDLIGFVDLLKNRTFVIQAGATVMSGLQGLVAIPTLATSATAYWVAENTAPTEGALVFGQLTMSPKMLGAYVDVSRRLINQSSVDAENLVRNELVNQCAIALDLAALNGAGTGSEPAGILASTSVGTVTGGANGAAPTWQSIVDLESAVANANADRGSLSYFINSKTRGKFKTVTKSTSAVTGFLWENGATPVNGYQAYVTNQLPSNLTKGTSTAICSAAIFGNFSDLMIGQWGGVDLMVDPYTGSNAGTLRVVCLQDVDVKIRRDGSFAYIKDLLTT